MCLGLVHPADASGGQGSQECLQLGHSQACWHHGVSVQQKSNASNGKNAQQASAFHQQQQQHIWFAYLHHQAAVRSCTIAC